ncbi:MAG: phosphoribosylglycinamide formyltransferase, partial [Acidimicrobiia bacterium]
GSGSNLQALIDAQDAGPGYAIAVVISDRADVGGLERAAGAGIPVEVVAWSDFESRSGFSAAVCDTADRFGAKGLVLAGFMRILAPNAIERFPNAIINVHPALLPAFPGAHAVEHALDHGVTLTGVTVHFVDEQVDHGPIILQEAIRVEADDDPTSLHSRIQEVEHRLLPDAVSAFARGSLTVQGRHVRWDHLPEEAIGS